METCVTSFLAKTHWSFQIAQLLSGSRHVIHVCGNVAVIVRLNKGVGVNAKGYLASRIWLEMPFKRRLIRH
jgi:hypothetical protein